MIVKDLKGNEHELISIEELYLWAKEQGLEKAGIGLSLYDNRTCKERKENGAFEYCEEIIMDDIYTGSYYIDGKKTDCDMIWLHNR